MYVPRRTSPGIPMSRRIDPNLHKSKTISKQTYQKIVHRNIQRADNLRAIRLYKSLYFFCFWVCCYTHIGCGPGKVLCVLISSMVGHVHILCMFISVLPSQGSIPVQVQEDSIQDKYRVEVIYTYEIIRNSTCVLLLCVLCVYVFPGKVP